MHNCVLSLDCRKESFFCPAGPLTPKLFLWLFDHKTIGKDKEIGDGEVDVRAVSLLSLCFCYIYLSCGAILKSRAHRLLTYLWNCAKEALSACVWNSTRRRNHCQRMAAMGRLHLGIERQEPHRSCLRLRASASADDVRQQIMTTISTVHLLSLRVFKYHVSFLALRSILLR